MARIRAIVRRLTALVIGNGVLKDPMAEYDQVGPFSEGLAWAEKGGMMFHIRSDGSRAYAESYDGVGNFCEGSAPAMTRDGKFILIRPDGTRIT